MGLDMYVVEINEKNQQEEIAYYRKFNALYGYFDERYQLENPGEVEITMDIVLDLIERLENISNDFDKASRLLPVSYGPFFGSYNYDVIYFSYINEALKDFKFIQEKMKRNNKSKFFFCADY